jgi:anthranilate synthase component 1
VFTPDLKTFTSLAKSADFVPVVKELPADFVTPLAAFLRLARKEKYSFLLESVEGGEKIGRYTFLGARPARVFTSKGDQISVSGHGTSKRQRKFTGNPFASLQEFFANQRAASFSGLPPFTGGAVGYVGYDAVRQLEELPNSAEDDLKLPDIQLMFFDEVVAFDHVRQSLFVMVTADVRKKNAARAFAAATKKISAIERKLAKPVREERTPSKPVKAAAVKATTRRSDFLADVRRIKEYVAAGDVFQCVLSQRFEAEFKGEPIELYRALRRLNPSPYMYFLRMGELHVIGASPERLLRATKQAANTTKLEYRPIAGTRPRGKDEAHDAKLEAELLADEKERAEHVMLVDLGRNDLGRVSEYGSVKVKDLMFVERYSHVMHLVSALESTLRKGLNPWDAFAACFPAGTLSGAPKVRAMEIIEELEPLRRGVYGGAICYSDFSGNLDSCIAIRTAVVKGKKVYIQAGAGIVADSIPEREFEECVNKAGAVMRASGVAK